MAGLGRERVSNAIGTLMVQALPPQRLIAWRRENNRHSLFFEPTPELAVTAIDRVAAHPAAGHAISKGSFRHSPGQLGLAGKVNLVGDAGFAAAL